MRTGRKGDLLNISRRPLNSASSRIGFRRWDANLGYMQLEPKNISFSISACSDTSMTFAAIIAEEDRGIRTVSEIPPPVAAARIGPGTGIVHPSLGRHLSTQIN